MSLMNVLVRETYPAGATIFLENEPAASFYIIESGRVEVKFEDPKKKNLILGTQ